MIAEAHQTYVERMPGFAVVGVVDCGGEALRLVAQTPVDLVLLDFYLPDMGGLDVCRALRGHGAPVDVIAVTSAGDRAVVRTAVAYGVVQYLLKPVSFATFRERLERYADYRRQISGTGVQPEPGGVAQHDVDRALAALREPTPAEAPQGLSAATHDVVIGQLRAAGGPLSAVDVADGAGISRVTARRYLEHLVGQHSSASTRRPAPRRPDATLRNHRPARVPLSLGRPVKQVAALPAPADPAFHGAS
ncbi:MULTISPECIES: response regulator [unclassified Frankia]|uniref:response regulator n=1 Tax=unclassified Frankia TaxID=2632575 RepID=UPI002AD2A5EE|nr:MULTISPECIES: response regulator [unclassified Frankia]